MTNKQGYLGDLKKKTKPELLELLERQQKLLEKKKFIDSLPDKGAKIKNFYEKIKVAIRQREEIDSTADLFAKLQISQERPYISSSIGDLDSDDDDFPDENGNDEFDSSAVVPQDAKVSSPDLAESFLYADKTAKALDIKAGSWDDSKATPKSKLLTNTGRGSPRHDSCDVQILSVKQKWGESAVTPPVFSNKPAKLLTLQESMELIRKQAKTSDVLETLAQRVKFADGDSVHNPVVALHRCDEPEIEVESHIEEEVQEDEED